MSHHKSTRVRRDFGKLQCRNFLQGTFARCRDCLNFDHAIVGEGLAIRQRDSCGSRVVRIVVQRP